MEAVSKVTDVALRKYFPPTVLPTTLSPAKNNQNKRSVIKGADPTMQARPRGINKPTNQRMVDESSIEYTDGHMH